MMTERQRSRSASLTLNGAGLPESTKATASSVAQRGSLTMLSGSARPGSGAQRQQQQQQTWLANASRDAALPSGVLLGSLAGYLPVSAVAYANSAATTAAAPPHTSASPGPTVQSSGSLRPQQHAAAAHPLEARSLSMLHGSRNIPERSSPWVRHGGVRSGDGAPPLAPQQQRKPSAFDVSAHASVDATDSQDLHSSRQSITVLNVTRDGQAQEWTRPPSNTSTAQASGSVAGEPRSAPAPPRPQRRSSFGSGGAAAAAAAAAARGSANDRVRLEAMAPIAETSMSSASTVHPSVPYAVAAAEARQQQQQQQQQLRPPVPRPPRHGSTSTSTVLVPAPSATARPELMQPTPLAMSPSATTSSPAASTPSYGGSRTSRPAAPTAAAHGGHRSSPTHSTIATVPAAAGAVNGGGGVVALHHRPSVSAAAVRGAGQQPPASPATLQVSTTTLTKATTKVRYLLPDDVFHPDAPDPSDVGGLTEAEEEALLDPATYSRAVDDVAGRYPLLLRQSSAQGGDQLRRGSGGPRPTFLLDDGNRWVRATNRPAVATTRDPAGTTTTLLPAPRILQKTSAAHASATAASDAGDVAFPAHHRSDGGGDGTAAAVAGGGYLLQRHVQQMATGKELVRGTVYAVPATPVEHREQRRREQAAAAAAAAQDHRGSTRNGGHGSGSVPTSSTAGAEMHPQQQQQRRQQQQQQHLLPLSSSPSGATETLYREILTRAQHNRRAALPTTVLPAAAPPVALRLPPTPTTGDRRRGRPHPSSAEPTPLHRGSGVQPGGALSHASAAPPSQPPRSYSQPYIPITYDHYDDTPSGSEMGSRDGYRTPLVNTAAVAARTPTQRTSQPRQQQQQQQQQALPPRQPPSAAAPHGRPPLPGPKAQQDSPPPRAQQQQQQPRQQNVLSCAPPVGNGAAAPGHTSGRFSMYNGAIAAPPPPPPPPPPPSNPTPAEMHLRGGGGGGGGTAAGRAPVHHTAQARRDVDEDDEVSGGDMDSSLADDEDARVADRGSSFASDEPVTDAAGMRTPGRHGRHDTTVPGDGMPQRSPTVPAFGYDGAAVAEVRRSLLGQRSGHAAPAETLAPPRQLQPTHTESRAHHPSHGRQKHGAAAATSSPPPPSSSYRPRPPSTAITSRTASRAASVDQYTEEQDGAASASVCDTDTQPVSVRERGEDDDDDDADGGAAYAVVKKGPTLVVFPDDAATAEEEEEEEEAEEYDEEEEYWAGDQALLPTHSGVEEEEEL